MWDLQSYQLAGLPVFSVTVSPVLSSKKNLTGLDMLWLAVNCNIHFVFGKYNTCECVTPPPPPSQSLCIINIYYSSAIDFLLLVSVSFSHTHWCSDTELNAYCHINEYFRRFKPEGKEHLLMNGYTQHCSNNNILRFGGVHFLTRFEFTQNVWFAVVCVPHKMQLQSVNFTKYLKIGCVCLCTGGKNTTHRKPHQICHWSSLQNLNFTTSAQALMSQVNVCCSVVLGFQ